ncbi:sensor histidine kinase [Bacillus mycoides]|uniref:sensor histidine kinase n=1 Tax=Bacillus mycoides TaxID=1405 RepID=UPI003D05F083
MGNLHLNKSLLINNIDTCDEKIENYNELKVTVSLLTQENLQLKLQLEDREKMEFERQKFISTFIHELNAPITAIRGQIEGMIHEVGIYRDREKYLRKSNDLIKEIELLAAEILQASNLGQYRFIPKLEPVDLQRLISEVVQQLNFFAVENKIKIILRLEKVPTILIDYNLLKKAIKNIIHNAIMYSPKSENVYISLKFDMVNTLIKLKVLNISVPITKAQLIHIFKPFYRINKLKDKNKKGNGLGLYIVQQIFDIFSVKYSLENTEKGVCFDIEIPIIEGSPNRYQDKLI